MMKKMLLAAFGLSLVAGTALAGEGSGIPFPYRGAPISVTVNNYKSAGKMQDPFPYASPGMALQTDAVLPSVGSEGAVQTANSLPVGALTEPANIAVVNRNAAPAVVAMPSTPIQPRG